MLKLKGTWYILEIVEDKTIFLNPLDIVGMFFLSLINPWMVSRVAIFLKNSKRFCCNGIIQLLFFQHWTGNVNAIRTQWILAQVNMITATNLENRYIKLFHVQKRTIIPHLSIVERSFGFIFKRLLKFSCRARADEERWEETVCVSPDRGYAHDAWRGILMELGCGSLRRNCPSGPDRQICPAG